MSGHLQWLVDKEAAREQVRGARAAGKQVGLVPTMGNLHLGHASLIRQARSETDFVVVSLFVNPIQFVAGEDLANYPRTPAEDRSLCEREGADLVFAPTVEAMYPPDSRTRVQVHGLEEPLCGQNRPGHFVGVATIVTKLFHLLPPDIAYFGQKDYQQARLMEQLVADLDFPIEIRVCPTVREPDGLALSSRNAYLTPEERRQATCLYQALQQAQKDVAGGEKDPKAVREKALRLIMTQPLARVDYAEIVDSRNLAPVARIDRPVVLALAVRFGRARLIDNAVLSPLPA